MCSYFFLFKKKLKTKQTLLHLVWEGTWKRPEVQNIETTTTSETSSNNNLFFFVLLILKLWTSFLSFIHSPAKGFLHLEWRKCMKLKKKTTNAVCSTKKKQSVEKSHAWKQKKQIVTTGCFRDSTGGFCVLEFWPFSSSFSNKDVTKFDLVLVFFLKQEQN